MTQLAELQAHIRFTDSDGSELTLIDNTPATRSIHAMVPIPDKFASILGYGDAQTSIEVTETMGGPYGYSSVRVHVGVSLKCDQTEAAIKGAQKLALHSCIEFIDEHIGQAHKILCAHLEQNYQEG